MSALALPNSLAGTLKEDDCRIVVTGATGWVGSATLDMLLGALGAPAFFSRVIAFASRTRTLQLQNGMFVRVNSLDEIEALPPGRTLIFHYAFLGRERVSSLSLEDYCTANAKITGLVRGAVLRLRPLGMLLTSSGAVYRRDRSIDDDLSMNPYGVLKHRDENIFGEACDAAGAKLVVARVFNLSGEYINKVANYALSSFIMDALCDRPLSIRAPQIVERSYLGVGDFLTASLSVMLEPSPAHELFDTTGERTVEIGELAGLVRDICGRGDLALQRPAIMPDRGPDQYVGDPKGLQLIAARHSIRFDDLRQQIERTASYLSAAMRMGLDRASA